MIRPIPLSLLCHTVIHEPVLETDIWNDKTVGANTIENVRVEPTKTLVYSGDGERISGQTLLFIDSVHSTKSNFKEGDAIIFNDHRYHISSIAEFYEFNQLHHLEIRLI